MEDFRSRRMKDAQRLWKDDDPSAYTKEPTDWPHDEEGCDVCLAHWMVFGERVGHTKSGGHYIDGDWHGVEAHEIVVLYPNRIKAIFEHRHRVGQSRRAHKAQENAARPSQSSG